MNYILMFEHLVLCSFRYDLFVADDEDDDDEGMCDDSTTSSEASSFM